MSNSNQNNQNIQDENQNEIQNQNKDEIEVADSIKENIESNESQDNISDSDIPQEKVDESSDKSSAESLTEENKVEDVSQSVSQDEVNNEDKEVKEDKENDKEKENEAGDNATEETDEIVKPKSIKMSANMDIIKIAGVLAILAFATAFMLAVLNNITSPKIQERLLQEKAEAVALLFGDNMTVTKFDGELSSPVVEILYVSDQNNNLIGYCVTTQPKGFGGKINTLVAIDADGKITGINILELSETAGVGTKIQEDSFLGQFKGKSDISGIDTIGGATVSSKALLSGIDAALYQLESKIMQ